MSTGLAASTVTPGRTPPDASLTTPVMAACAWATAGKRIRTNRATAAHEANLRIDAPPSMGTLGGVYMPGRLGRLGWNVKRWFSSRGWGSRMGVGHPKKTAGPRRTRPSVEPSGSLEVELRADFDVSRRLNGSRRQPGAARDERLVERGDHVSVGQVVDVD